MATSGMTARNIKQELQEVVSSPGFNVSFNHAGAL